MVRNRPPVLPFFYKTVRILVYEMGRLKEHIPADSLAGAVADIEPTLGASRLTQPAPTQATLLRFPQESWT